MTRAGLTNSKLDFDTIKPYLIKLYCTRKHLPSIIYRQQTKTWTNLFIQQTSWYILGNLNISFSTNLNNSTSPYKSFRKYFFLYDSERMKKKEIRKEEKKKTHLRTFYPQMKHLLFTSLCNFFVINTDFVSYPVHCLLRFFWVQEGYPGGIGLGQSFYSSCLSYRSKVSFRYLS